MKFFYSICLTTFTLLMIVFQTDLHLAGQSIKRLPSWLVNYQEDIKDTFSKRELANVLLASFTGKKDGIGHNTKVAMKRVNVFFLLSPGGFHVALFLAFIFFPLRSIAKKLKYIKLFTVYLAVIYTNQFSILRSLINRIIYGHKSFLNFQITTELIFYSVFIFLMIIGQFSLRPLSFIYSYAYVGCFLAFRDDSKLRLILGLFTIELILSIFLRQRISLLSIPIGLILTWIYSYIFLAALIFYLTYWIFKINWIEPFVNLYIITCKKLSHLINGSFSASSLSLIIATLLVLNMNKFKLKKWSTAILILLHTNTAVGPDIVYS